MRFRKGVVWLFLFAYAARKGDAPISAAAICRMRSRLGKSGGQKHAGNGSNAQTVRAKEQKVMPVVLCVYVCVWSMFGYPSQRKALEKGFFLPTGAYRRTAGQWFFVRILRSCGLCPLASKGATLSAPGFSLPSGWLNLAGVCPAQFGRG